MIVMMVKLGKGVLILILALVTASGALSRAEAAENVELKFFSAGKKVIPLTARLGSAYFITDVVPPDVLITNTGTAAVNIRGAAVVGLSGGNEAVTYRLGDEAVGSALIKANTAINSAAAKNEQAFLHFRYANFSLPEAPLAQDGTLGPGQSAVLPLPDLLHISYIGRAWLDTLRLEVAIDGQTVIMPIELTFYHCKGRYIFPLRGDIHLANLPGNLVGHRHAGSQEFAIDIVGMGAAGVFSAEAFKSGGIRLEDHYIFNREILAAADGTVVATGTRFSEAPTREKDYAANYLKLARQLAPVIGIVNTVGGNHIIIDHGNGEYAFYAHIREGHVLVKPGDKVKQGQVIGRVGNTGNSSGPHLHFQLMDSADMLKANGLPIMFTNIPIGAAYMTGVFHETNSLLNTDDLYLHLD